MVGFGADILCLEEEVDLYLAEEHARSTLRARVARCPEELKIPGVIIRR